MERKFSFAPYEYYHLYNRGVDKRDTFINKKDYVRWMKLLYLCNSTRKIDLSEISDGKEFDQILNENIVDIGAWCIMPNHFHILVRAKELPKGFLDNRKGYPSGVSLFMNKLQTGYSMYFNKKYKRSGRLFQGTFKARHVNNDVYLHYLFAYIHLNSIALIDHEWEENTALRRVGMKEFLLDHPFSSYVDYIGNNRQEAKIISRDVFPDYFEKIDSFEKFVDLWISHENNHFPPEE